MLIAGIIFLLLCLGSVVVIAFINFDAHLQETKKKAPTL